MPQDPLTRPWSNIRKLYQAGAGRPLPAASVRAIRVMVDLVEVIGSSPLAGTLHAWSEHFDLCIVPASHPGHPRFRCYPHCGAQIRVSPRPGDKLVFAYLPDLRAHLAPVFGGKSSPAIPTDELRATIARLMVEGRIEDEAGSGEGFAKLQEFLARFGWPPKDDAS